MKKIYDTPTLDAVRIESVQLMALSGNPDEDTKDQYSHGYEGPAGGLLWEDESGSTNNE